MNRYIDYKHQNGQPVGDLISRSNVHILPVLGDLVVSELTAEQLRRWRSNMATSPAQRRAKGGKPQYRSEPTTDEERRARRASANRVLTMLKAALNMPTTRPRGEPRRLGTPSRTVREGRRGTRAVPDRRGGRAADQRLRAGLPRAGACRTGDRLPLRGAGAARGWRLRPRRQHARD